MRLAYLYNGNSYARSEGRLEVCYNDDWGTVCDDSFDYSDAQVACYDLGYSKTGPNYYYHAYFGQGVGTILLDDLHCNGNENSLWSCPHNGVGSHNCGHGEDIGVRCYGKLSHSNYITIIMIPLIKVTLVRVAIMVMYVYGEEMMVYQRMRVSCSTVSARHGIQCAVTPITTAIQLNLLVSSWVILEQSVSHSTCMYYLVIVYT